MRKFKLSLALLALALSGPLLADSYAFDTAHTNVGFIATHLTFAKVHGRFTKYEGKIDIHAKDITKSKLEFKAEVNSVQTGVEKRDNHLKSVEFFDAEKTPYITFKSTKIEKAGDGAYSVTGDLTMRGVTKPITLRASLSDAFETDWGATKRAFSLEGTVKRMDFGVAWNKTTKTGGLVVADEIKIVIEGEIDKK